VTLVAGWWNAYRATLSHAGPAASSLRVAWFPRPPFFPFCPKLFLPKRTGLLSRCAVMLVPDVYWATLAGGALVIIEWALDPAWRQHPRWSRREARSANRLVGALFDGLCHGAQYLGHAFFAYRAGVGDGAMVALLAARRTVVRDQS